MRKAGHIGLFAIIVLLLFVAVSANAGEARDITALCKISTRIGASTLKNALDGKYATRFASGTGERSAISVALPSGEEAGGLYIKWFGQSVTIRIQVETDSGYETIAISNTPYLCDYIPLPEGVTAFRFLQAEKVKGRMYIADMRVFSRGEAPDDVQRWEPSWPKADLLVITTHPDDEVLFLGGTIPYYAHELGMAVQVACVVPATPERRLEMLDGLWHCGLRHYPAFGHFADVFGAKMQDVQKRWGKNRLDRYMVQLYRAFQPEVVVTQDLRGEYGHGAHMAVADAASRCVKYAADPAYDKTSRTEFGVWQVKKLYIHLYEKNQILMNWRVPLDSFGGKTAFDIASEAFLFHVSQQKGIYSVEDSGPYNNALFGLYATTVGEDTAGNDFFENIH